VFGDRLRQRPSEGTRRSRGTGAGAGCVRAHTARTHPTEPPGSGSPTGVGAPERRGGTVESERAMKSIYVGNLPFSSSEEDVRRLFEQYGSVHSVKLINDRETGRPRGFGFVEMDESEAVGAIEALIGRCASTRRCRATVGRRAAADTAAPGLYSGRQIASPCETGDRPTSRPASCGHGCSVRGLRRAWRGSLRRLPA
jgi:hypothetical protein